MISGKRGCDVGRRAHQDFVARANSGGRYGELQRRGSAGHGHSVFAADLGGKPLLKFRQRLAKGTRYFSATKRLQDGLDFFFAEIRLVNRYSI
jgi:hypothetical protein